MQDESYSGCTAAPDAEAEAAACRRGRRSGSGGAGACRLWRPEPGRKFKQPAELLLGFGRDAKPGGNLTVYLLVELPARPAESFGGGAAGARCDDEPRVSVQDRYRPADDHGPFALPDLGVSAESPDAITWTIKLRHGREVPQHRAGQRACGRGGRHQGDVRAGA